MIGLNYYENQRMNIESLLEQHSLTPTDIERLKAEAKQEAIHCGKGKTAQPLSIETWNIFDALSKNVWDSNRELSEKIQLGFILFDTFPNYFHFLTPFYDIIENKDLKANDLKDIIWKTFMEYLGSDQWYASPVSYVLWVDFFEDSDTVLEAWQGMMNQKATKKSLANLIKCAGPVPFELKEPLYKKMLKDNSLHESIFYSLLFSALDVYGNIDKNLARAILIKLKIKTNTPEYRLLKTKLKI